MPGERMWAVAVSRNLVDKVIDLMAEFGRSSNLDSQPPHYGVLPRTHTNQDPGLSVRPPSPPCPPAFGGALFLQCAAHRISTG